MLSGPAFRFRAGRVVEIEHDSGRFGYLIAHFKVPREGDYFTLIKRVFDAPLPDEIIPSLLTEASTTIWLNTYKMLERKAEITLRHKCDLDGYEAQRPSIWFGQVDVWMTVKHPDGTQEIRTTELSEPDWEDEMERQGIMHAVLWLPKCVGEFLFNGVPLRWTVRKKY